MSSRGPPAHQLTHPEGRRGEFLYLILLPIKPQRQTTHLLWALSWGWWPTPGWASRTSTASLWAH